jgi:type VI secretion system protein ImpH
MNSEPSAALQSLLVTRLIEEPYRFDLFQAIRILEHEVARSAAALGKSVPPLVGGLERGAGVDTGIRFQAAASLRFPTASVTRVQQHSSHAVRQAPHTDDTQVFELEQSCLGLVGPAGTLPPHYTSLVVDRYRRHRDTTLREFLDVFVHRLVALNYRAWAKYRPEVGYEQERVTSRGVVWTSSAVPQAPATAIAASFVGIGGDGLADRMAVTDETIFSYVGFFSRGPRSAASFEHVLADLLELPVVVNQFVGRWLELEESDQTSLASVGRPQGVHAQLGSGALAGKRAWDIASTFEIAIGPVDWHAFQSFLPGQPAFVALADFVRLAVGASFRVMLRLVLEAPDVPQCRLGEEQVGGLGSREARLGWSTWLVSSQGASADRSDTAFTLCG